MRDGVQAKYSVRESDSACFREIESKVPTSFGRLAIGRMGRGKSRCPTRLRLRRNSGSEISLVLHPRGM